MGTLALALSGLSLARKRPIIRVNSIVYDASGIYNSDPALQPTFSNLNDGNYATGVGTTNLSESWVRADLGEDTYIVEVGLAAGILPATWGSVQLYLNGATIQTATEANPSSWTNHQVVSGFVDDSNSLDISKKYYIGVMARYIRLLFANNWLSTTEFSVWSR